MTPQELKTSILNKAMQGFFVNADWRDTEESIFKYLWEVTTWDKKFKGVDKYKQKRVISYYYYLAADMKALERSNGDVYLLSTGQYEGYTTQELVADTMSEGEVVSIPWGGSPNIKYYRGKFVTSDNRIATSNNTCILSNKFLYYYMLSQYDYLKSIYRGTSLKHPEMAAVLDMRIPVPTLPEQEQTVAKIEELLPLIERYEQAWSKLEDFNKCFPVDMQKSILQMAIQGKLVPQLTEEGTGEELFQQIQTEKQALIEAGKIKKEKPLPEITEDEVPYDIPESWKWVRLGQLIHIESGKGLTAAQMRPGIIPVYGGNGITGYHDESFLHEETVVIGRVGFYCGSVHVTEKECWVTDNAFITTYPQNSIDRTFLVYMLRHMDLGQNNNATAQPVVSGKKIYPMLFPLPPLAEQKRIVAKLEEILPLCERLK